MTQNNVTHKGLIVGIVLLFLTIAFSPIINADGNKVPQTIGDVPITIFECKADGTIEKTVVRMSQEQADNFNKEMRNTHDLNARLSIYKKYDLISHNITADSLQSGMKEKAQTMGLTQDNLISQFRSNRSLFPPLVRRNIFCSVSGGEGYWNGFCFPPIIRGVRLIGLFFFIIECSITSKGLLGEFYLQGLFVKLVGFVGIIEVGSSKWRYIDFDGFCVYVKALGIPD
jgi:hypothetical protein